jgi:pyruvate/2-oxoglutarate dehydrogenase complex dihydrolipoamide acyltransferase (E2) component
MRVFRRVVLPVAWLAVFAVIAAALVKIAFVDGMTPEASVAGPGAEVMTPVVQAKRATVTNTVEIKATVQSDAATSVRSTVAGVVTHIFLEPGAKVASGERLYQVRSELPAVSEPEVVTPTTAGGQPGASASQLLSSRAVPLYTYADVLAPVSGTLDTLTVLLNQQVSVGEATGTVDPGTFTVSGPVNASQQYRLLAKPASAQILVVGGPAPFTCSSVALKNNAAAVAAGTTGGGLAGASGGSVGRSVPYAVAGPGGGSAAPEQDSTATGTISCAVPSGVEVFAGLGATMTVTAGQSANVVTVPLTSVQGSVKEGIVWLAPAGSAAGNPAGTGSAGGPEAGQPGNAVPRNSGGPPEQRKVQLGLNDGAVVEIVSGLAEGESVLEFIPGAPAQQQSGPQFAGPGSATAGG